MSGGVHCTCTPEDRRFWRIVLHKCNYSKFSGGRQTFSDYSELRCLKCGHYWRTKAKYVDEIAFAEGDEAYGPAGTGTYFRDGKPIETPIPKPLTRAEQRQRKGTPP